MIDYDILATEDKARYGEMTVNKKRAKTPLFMPVATKGSVKTLISEDLEDLEVQAIISNMYHLLLKPGIEIFEEVTSLHDFMNWDGILFTDSGGFQMIRSAFKTTVKEDKVNFKTENGDQFEITPERCIELQKKIGSDVAMCLDYCPPYPTDRGEIEKSVDMTTDWAKRCKKKGENIFGICQGGTIPELREESSRQISNLNFGGNAIGGLSIGEPKETMYKNTELAADIFPEEKPRYFMGLGSPIDVLECISLGVDVFDSAYPTRNARHKTIFTRDGNIRIDKAKYANQHRPLDSQCDCPTCKNYSRAYVHHLCKADELSWMRLTTLHNIKFMMDLMEGARTAIDEGRFEEYKADFKKRYKHKNC